MNKIFTRRNLLVLSLAAAAPLSFYIGQATYAAGPAAGAALIDKDFESALRKFVSKRFYNRIDATAKQREQLEAIWTGTMDGTRPMREELREGLLDLSNLFASDAASDEQIAAKAHELRALHEKIADQRLDSMLKARHVLTKEQRDKINQCISEVITGGLRPRRLSALLEKR
jgi:Spy/CpxP family protein refolding chaperone